MNEPASLEYQRLAEKSARLLRESEHDIDARTLARLSAARARAVAAVGAQRPIPTWWLPAGALAATVLALLVLPYPGSLRPVPTANRAGAEALEVLSDEFEPDFYLDLEFYRWLDDTAAHV